MIGKKLSPILEEIEAAIIEFDFYKNTKPNYSDTSIRAAAKIFLSVLMDKMWELQEKENMPQNERLAMAEKCRQQIRQLIKTFCNVDSFEFYNETIVGKDFIISKSIK
jgi:hypothetical protein